MQKYFAAAAIILMLTLVIIRVFMLKKQGIKAIKFGGIDKKDFLIPPFMLFYFYLIFANAFQWPSIGGQELFRNEIAAWAGVFLCLTALLLLFWSLVSFRKSFRIGIDLNQSGGLITTGVFAFSRNPIYVSFGFVLLGQFCIFSGWVLLLYTLAGIALFHRQVLREEEFLKKQYGKEYLVYCKKVRRYL